MLAETATVPRLHHSIIEDRWRILCKLGALAALILLIYCVATFLVLLRLGGAPASVQQCFDLIRTNRIVALLRLDLLTILAMPVFALLYAGLFVSLRRHCPALSILGMIAALMGTTLILASASVFSLTYLSDQYAVAATDSRRLMLLAAGEAVLATDTWHGMGAWMGGSLLQLAGTLFSIAMLRSAVFGKITAYSGLVTHGLDLLHIFAGVFSVATGAFLMFVAGPLYFVWLPLVALRLYQLGRSSDVSMEQVS